MIILGIETTCDETGVGIVKDGRILLSNVVSSSAMLHEKYSGVVPEIAAREQVKVIIPVIIHALSEADISLTDVDAVAVAHGPGLVGSLLIGTETAKVLALTLQKPLIPVNHLIGHVYANWLTPLENSKLKMVNGVESINYSRFTVNFPFVALIVSGGHTDLILMTGHGKYSWLGGTLDDAAGEVFDKVARSLGLGYPGGPEIEKIACDFQIRSPKSEIRNFRFPRPMIAGDNFDFSFSGLKTAVVNSVNSSSLTDDLRQEIAYEFQNAVVEVLIKKTVHAVIKFSAKSIVVGGGVAANGYLRSEFSALCSELELPLFFPSKNLSVDNGAMIAAAAHWLKRTINPLKLQSDPSLLF